MALVVPDLGELELLDKLLKDALSTNEDFILKLYKTDHTPVAASLAAEFTEATFTNYSVRTLARATWNAASTISNKASSSYGSTPLSWTCGATGNTIYGYYVIGATSNVCLWAEKFSTARVLAEDDILNLTPKFTLASEA